MSLLSPSLWILQCSFYLASGLQLYLWLLNSWRIMTPAHLLGRISPTPAPLVPQQNGNVPGQFHSFPKCVPLPMPAPTPTFWNIFPLWGEKSWLFLFVSSATRIYGACEIFKIFFEKINRLTSIFLKYRFYIEPCLWPLLSCLNN